MKNKAILFALFVAGSTLISCKKYQSGCMDSEAENYSNTAKMDDGSCIFQHSSDVTVSNWTYNDPLYSATITWGNLTQEVIDRGSISIYMVYSNSSIVELPFTASYSASYSSHWYWWQRPRNYQ